MKITVKDGTGTSKEAEVYQKAGNGRDYPTGLSVYTMERHDYKQRSLIFTNPENGRDMTVDAMASGASVLVHNGGDTSAWTGNEITGNSVDFASVNRVISGSASIEVDNPSLNDVWEFSNGGSQSLSAYDALTGSINIDKNWEVGDEVSVYGWDGALVGTPVLLESYVSQTDYDVNQSFSIPLVDLGLVGVSITALRMEQTGKVGGRTATFYLDDITFTESGTLTYTAKPGIGKIVEFQRIEISLANNVTVVNYDDFLGEALTTGFTLQRFEKNVPQIALRYLTLSDMLALTWEVADLVTGTSKTYLKLRADLPVPSVLEGNQEDRLEITLSDDFSGLELMNAIVIGQEYVDG